MRGTYFKAFDSSIRAFRRLAYPVWIPQHNEHIVLARNRDFCPIDDSSAGALALFPPARHALLNFNDADNASKYHIEYGNRSQRELQSY